MWEVDMKIYWIKAQAPRRVLALAKHLGIDAEFIEVDLKGGGLKTQAYAALNPNMKAPTLVDGDVAIWEASAIMLISATKRAQTCGPRKIPPSRWKCCAGCRGTIAIG